MSEHTVKQAFLEFLALKKKSTFIQEAPERLKEAQLNFLTPRILLDLDD